MYEEKLARPDWAPRDGHRSSPACSTAARRSSSRSSNAGFTDPQTIILAYFQASLLVDHIVDTYGDDGLHKLLRAYGEGLDTDAAMQAGARHRPRRLAGGVRSDARGDVRRAARGAQGARGRDGEDAARRTEGATPRSTEGNYIGADGARRGAAQAGDLDEADGRPSRRPRPSCRWSTGDDSPNAQIADDRAAEERHARARSRRSQALVTSDFNNIDAARQLAALMRESGVTDPAQAAAGLSARSWTSIRSMPRRTRRLAGCSMQHEHRPMPRRAVQGRGRAETGRPGVGLHRSGRELLQERQARGSAQADAGGARNRAELRARAGPAAKLPRRVRDTTVRAGCWHRAVACSALFTLVPSLQPTVDAQLPAVADDRFAGLQWRFVRIKYHYVDRRHARMQQDFYGEPWLIDGPAAEQNLSRRIKTATVDRRPGSDRADARRSAALHLSVDLLRRAGQPDTHRRATRRSLREFLLRGGTALFDDFHGPFEWEHFAGRR